MISRGLVAAQFAALAVLLLPFGRRGYTLPGWLFILAGLGFLAWTVRHNRVGNFNIRPEARVGAYLATEGPYRWVRHPMYFGVLLAGGGVVMTAPALFRWAAWLALLGVLVAKARREERVLEKQFPAYVEYRRGRRFLVPGIW